MIQGFLPRMPITTRTSSQSIFIQDKLAIAITATPLAAASMFWLVSHSLMPLMMSSSSGMSTGMGVAGIVSSLALPAVVFIEVVWVIGMAAMMFPAIIPMVLFYNGVKARIQPNPLVARAGGTLF